MRKLKQLTLILLAQFLISCGGSDSNVDASATPSRSGIEASTVYPGIIFPRDNPWNQDISNEPLDPKSDIYISSLGSDTFMSPDFGTWWEGAPLGMPFVVVSGNQPKVPVAFDYAHESDPGPYPIPPDVPIQGGPQSTGDRHVIIIDRDNQLLYEMYYAFPDGNGGWTAASGAIFDLTSNRMRPAGWTSADAAGLPIFAGLVRYEEIVVKKELTHAIRFTANKTRKAYVYPARHAASYSHDPNLPPMGMRVRLKADYDISTFPLNVQVILRGLKKYGMILADNGVSWMISGDFNENWNDQELSSIRRVPGSAFEVIKMGTVTEME
jgi:hypothetical protein